MDDRTLEKHCPGGALRVGGAEPGVRRFLAVLTVCVVGASSCGDDPLSPGTVVHRIETTPTALTFDALGASDTIRARALDANGIEVLGPIGWISADPAVARVNAEGAVASVSNGSTTLTATAGGVSASVPTRVEQVLDRVQFTALPLALLSGSTVTLDVALVDRLGVPMTGANGDVTLRPEDPTTLTLQGPTTATLVRGRARFGDLLFDGEGFQQRLLVESGGSSERSQPFDVVRAFDRVVLEGAPGVDQGVLVDGISGGGTQNDVPYSTRGAALEVGSFRAGADGEIVAFATGRAPELRSVVWSDAPDSVALAMPTPVVVDVAIWIVKGPFAQQSAWAAQAIERTRIIWANERYGVDLGDIEVIDATQNPDGSGFFAFSGCSEAGNAQNRIGKRAGRINVYYVERVDGGTDRGRTCPVGGDFIVMAERSGDELLSHEFGHAFGLVHVDHLTGEFDVTNVMHSASSSRAYLTEAQTFRTHFDNGSVLNSALDLRPGRRVRSCPVLTGTLSCPSIEVRVWPDSSTAMTSDPLVTALSSGSGVHPLVRRWLEIDCMEGSNEGLLQTIRTEVGVLEELSGVALDRTLDPAPGGEQSKVWVTCRTRVSRRS